MAKQKSTKSIPFSAPKQTSTSRDEGDKIMTTINQTNESGSITSIFVWVDKIAMDDSGLDQEP